MKKLALLSALSLCFSLQAQTVATDFESTNGNRGAETCWGFGGFSLSNSSSRQPINGWSARSGSLSNNPNSYWLKSPFVNLSAGNITFNTRIHSNDGNNSYIVYVDFISYDANDTWGEGNIITGSSYTYTIPQFDVQAVSIPVPAALANDGNAYKVYFRFESAAGNRNRRAVMDDISIPGTFASDPANNCKPANQVADSDFDGVPDDQDDYPNDPTAVFDTYSPSQNSFGTIAFEDLFPAKGDYDFNDLVLDYNIRYTVNADNKVSRMQLQFQARAIGGSLIQGFGISFPNIATAQISSVSGNSLTTQTISTNANGAENGQSNAVIIACDDLEEIISRAGGAFFNTLPNNPKGTYSTLTIDLSFDSPQSMAAASDFSIFAFKNRDEEIHLADKVPTDLMDQTIFGSLDDSSNPATGRYFKTANNLPWAIQLSESFDYPAERVDILDAYLNFANWAQSGGSSSTNWYSNESGNRDNSKIYQ